MKASGSCGDSCAVETEFKKYRIRNYGYYILSQQLFIFQFCRFTYSGGSLKVQLFHVVGEEEEEQVQWTDSSAKKSEYFHIIHGSTLANYQFRNVKQADTDSSQCINTIGSFYCADTSDEMVAVGIGK